MRNISSSTRRVAGITAAALLALILAACTPGLPLPIIASPPVSGTSVQTPQGYNLVNIAGCLPAGGVVTAEVTRLDNAAEFNTQWLLQVRELGTDWEEQASFPWQEIWVSNGPEHATIVSEPVPAGKCVQILVQSPNYFDLRSPRFTYTVSW